jgi:hypothetical protein
MPASIIATRSNKGSFSVIVLPVICSTITSEPLPTRNDRSIDDDPEPLPQFAGAEVGAVVRNSVWKDLGLTSSLHGSCPDKLAIRSNFRGRPCSLRVQNPRGAHRFPPQHPLPLPPNLCTATRRKKRLPSRSRDARVTSSHVPLLDEQRCSGRFRRTGVRRACLVAANREPEKMCGRIRRARQSLPGRGGIALVGTGHAVERHLCRHSYTRHNGARLASLYRLYGG